MKKILLFFAIFGFMLFISSGTSSALEKVSLQLVWKNQFQFAGYYIAKEKGFYRDVGLDAEIREYRPGVNVTEDILSQNTDFGVGRSSLIVDKLSGKDIFLVAAIFQHSPHILLTKTRPDLKNITQLKNKKVMGTADVLGMVSLKAMFTVNGVVEGSYTKQKHSFSIDDLISGRTDAMTAYISNEPYQMEKKGVPYTVFHPKDYGFDFYGDILYTSQALYEKKPGQVKRFYQASLRGWKYAFEHIDETVRLIQEKYNTQNRSRDALVFEAKALQKMAYKRGVPLGDINQNRINQIAQVYRLLGLTRSAVSLNHFYYKPDRLADIGLTADEKKFLSKIQKIRVHNETNWAPYNFFENGKTRGYSIDYMNLVAEKLGIRIEYVTGPSWNEFINMIKDKQLDVMLNIVPSPERKKFLNFTNQFCELENAVFIREGMKKVNSFEDLFGKRVAIPKGFSSEAQLSRYPEIKLVTVKDATATIQAVASGEADALFDLIPVVQYYTRKLKVENVVLGGMLRLTEGDPIPLHIGVREDWPQMVSIFNKAMAAINDDDLLRIQNKWITSHEKETKGPVIGFTPGEKKWLQQHPVIKVVAENLPPYAFLENGEPFGYTIELMKLMSKMTGIKFTFEFNSMSESFRKIKSGEAILTLNKTMLKQSAEILHFGTQPFQVRHAIFAKTDRTDMNTLAALKGKTYVGMKGNPLNKLVEQKVPGAKIIHSENMFESLQMVSSGNADAAIMESNMGLYLLRKFEFHDIRIVGYSKIFGEKGVRGSYWAVAKQHPELVSILNKAFNTIDSDKRQQIWNKWFQFKVVHPTAKTDLKLTESEKAWIKAHPVIRVHNELNWPPFNFSVNGKPTGLSIDTMNLLAARIGIEIKYVSGEWDELLNQAFEKKLDVMLNIVKTPERQKYLLYTTPYSKNPTVIITKEVSTISDIESLFGKKVAIVGGFLYENILKTKFPEITRVPMKDTLETLKATQFGKVDAAIGKLSAASYLIQENMLTGLVIKDAFKVDNPEIEKLNIAVRNDWPTLVTLFNKALESITPEEKKQIRARWFGESQVVEKALALPDRIRFNQTNFILQKIAIIFTIIMIAILIAWIVRGRPKQLSIRETLFLVFFVLAGLIVSIGAFVTMLLDGQQKQSDVEAIKYESINLAFELKQSSDDLTKFARLYTVTGDQKYEQYFDAIIDIRDGRQAHPKNYSHSYWDHVAAGVVKLDHQGQTYSIQQRMSVLGLSTDEKEKLSLAKKESDALISLEERAMNAVKGKYIDLIGKFSINGEPDLKMARGLLHGKAYHEAKTRIMKPIDDFHKLLEWRTTNELNLIREQNQAIILGITTLTALTIGFALFVFLLLKRRIINPLSLLESGAHVIKSGDYSHHIDITSRDEVGDLASSFNAMVSSINDRTSRLKSIFETAVDGIIVIDTGSLIQEFSPAAEQIFGYSRGLVIGRKINFLMPEDDHSEQDRYLKNYFNQENQETQRRQIEIRGLHKNGSIFPLELSITEAMINEEMYFTCIVRDISDRKEAERDLRKLSSAVQQSPVSVVITDMDGSIEYVNPMFTTVTGYSLEEAIGQNPRILKADGGPEIDYKNLWNTILAGKEWHGEFLNKKKNGEHYWESASISGIEDEDGTIKYFIAVKEDITGQKKAQAELVEAKAAAESATQAKSDFLANMSHEIRTPMNAILGMTHLALQTDMTPKQHDYLKKTYASATSLLGLINDILDFSKIEAGKMDMESIDFHLEDVLDNVSTLISIKAEESGLALIFKTPPEVPRVLLGDPLRLGQVLINLANNAVKFTEEGEVTIETCLIAESNEQVTLQFAVRDTGIGLTQAQIGKLFQSFSQADTSTTRKFGGTGLGLTISKRLVEMMNGKIWVESEVGKGSSFIFTALFGYGDETELARSGSKMGVDEEALRPVLGARILLVEDNEINQQVARELLENAGFIVEIANDGQEGLEKVTTSAYDLVLMDVQMPVMDGYEATRKIREILEYKDLPVLAMTASVMVGDISNAIESGMNDHVAKPIDPPNLIAKLVQWIKPGERDVPDHVKKKQEAAPRERLSQLPQSLPGIKIAAGLSRLGDNQKLYRSLLKKFQKNQANSIQEIRTALEKKDLELAIRLAHTIKGVSGNIGAMELHAAARDLESGIIAEGEKVSSVQIESVQSHLDQVLTSITELENANHESASHSDDLDAHLDLSHIKPLIDELLALLEDDDTEAASVLDQLKEQFSGTRFLEKLKDLEEMIGEYDFEKALDYFKTLAAEINRSVD